MKAQAYGWIMGVVLAWSGVARAESLPAGDNNAAAVSLTPAFPMGINYWGTTFTTFYVNTNGNISFGASNSTFDPSGMLPTSTVAMIAPWGADVDTRGAAGAGENTITYSADNTGVVVTWNAVGYNARHTDLLNTFEVRLKHPTGSPAKDFDVEFHYTRCEWTTGDSSGGVNGLGGMRAQAGFDAGDMTRAVIIPGSGTANILNLCTNTNSGTAGVWVAKIRAGNISFCGDGVIQGTEECDGASIGGRTCMSDCRLAPGNAGAECTDPDDCTDGQCYDGFCCDAPCVGDCQACSAARGATRNGVCTYLESMPCDDHDLCTQMDMCMGGVCMGSNPVTCEAPFECVLAPSCDPATGACGVPIEKPNGTPCSEGQCVDGRCGPIPVHEVPDAGEFVPPTMTDEGGCDCRSTHSGASALGALVLLALFIRRSRAR